MIYQNRSRLLEYHHFIVLIIRTLVIHEKTKSEQIKDIN